MAGVALVAALAAIALSVPFAPPAHGDGAVSVSDTTAAPGQVLTVRGSGFAPGRPALIYLFPEAIELAQTTVDANGAFAVDVQIPPTARDGRKGMLVRSVHADGKYASMSVYLHVDGPPASATLSDNSLVPAQTVNIRGSRFFPGTEVYIVLFPEEVLLGRPTVAGDTTFSMEVRIPDLVLNGRHGIVVAGEPAGGGFAYLVLDATVSGGVGEVSPGYRVPRRDLATLGASTSTSSSSTSTTRADAGGATSSRGAGRLGDDDGTTVVAWALLGVCLFLLLLVVGAMWLRPSAGGVGRRRRVRRHRGPWWNPFRRRGATGSPKWP